MFSFSAFLIYLYMGIQVFRMDPSSRKNRWFLYFCLCFAVWSFAYVFVYPDHSKQVIWFWYKISALGWCSFPAIAINFLLALTLYEKKKGRPFGMTIHYIFFIPAVVFFLHAYNGTLIAKDFVFRTFGNIEVQNVDSPWYWAYLAYMAVLTLGGLVMVTVWGVRSPNKNEKKQALWIVSSGLLSFLLGIVFNILLPALSNNIAVLPAIAPLTSLIWLAGIRRAIRKYRLLEITPEVAADEIVSHIIDSVLLLNMDGTIRKSNRSAEVLLEYSGDELRELKVWDLFPRGENARYKFEDIRKGQSGMIQWEDALKTKKGKPLPMNCIVSCVNDRNKQNIGVIFVGQDLRLVKRLEKEVRKSEIAEKKLQKANENLEKKVAERTRELEMYATTDPMTGVYNRRIGLLLLEEEIHKAKRNQSVLTVCFLDINDLKTVNDKYGHKEGDDLILSVVNIIKENLRVSDIICRMGGDEFLLILLDCNLNQCLEVWDGVQKDIDEKNAKKIKPYLLSVSRGFAEYNPIYPMTLDEIITTADYQMYQFKKKFKKVMEGN
jgi:diguanylate cyclase (GGDEF)-like protein/PAS domain S-box-containing protein